MNDSAKTTAFAIVAVLILAVAFAVQPGAPTDDQSADTGEIFPEFTDPLTATSLEILDFNEETGDLANFKVAKVGGVWAIPSHHNYPADASSQMADAASSLVGLTKLSVESNDRTDHEDFGVKNPEDAKEGDAGVGMLVRMKDDKGNALINLIVGKEVEGGDDLRYARIASQDRVYVTKITTSKLTTKFEDWIEEDFLDLSPFDIKRVVFDNHSIDESRGTLEQGDVITLDHKSSEWSMAQLPEGSEINKEKLNDMKTAVDDLKIVDIDTKPEILIANLKKGDEFSDLKNQAQLIEIAQSLQPKGFFPVQVKKEDRVQFQVYSNEGQISVGMNDGVEYVLRFGEYAQDDKTNAASDEEKDKDGRNRFIYVVARVNEDLLEKPELKPVPELPKKEKADTPLPKPKANEEKKEPGAPGQTGAAGDAPKVDEKKKDELTEAIEKEQEKVKDLKEDQTKTEKEVTEAVDKAKDEAEKLKAELEKLRKENMEKLKKASEITQEKIDAIKKENERRQKEYDDKVKKAKERVDELNGRFAKWYYVISDDVYKKIHLTKKDILVEKSADAKFLDENKTKDGVKSTDSGLQYKVIKEGTGKSPSATDTVRVHYKGTLIDGTVFDESKGDPAEFQVDGVIKGWTEALQLMKEGAKWQLYIPADLAYGDKGSGDKIGPNRALIFEVELVEVK
jgi:hypothetical protein